MFQIIDNSDNIWYTAIVQNEHSKIKNSIGISKKAVRVAKVLHCEVFLNAAPNHITEIFHSAHTKRHHDVFVCALFFIYINRLKNEQDRINCRKYSTICRAID